MGKILDRHFSKIIYYFRQATARVVQMEVPETFQITAVHLAKDIPANNYNVVWNNV